MPSSTITLGSAPEYSVSFSAIRTSYVAAGGSMSGAVSLNALKTVELDTGNVPNTNIIVGTIFRVHNKGSPTGVGATFADLF